MILCTSQLCCCTVLILVLFITLRLVVLLTWRSAPKAKVSCKTLIVIGSGGHTSEMVKLLRGFVKNTFVPRLYVIADTDLRSQNKIEEFERSKYKSKEYVFLRVKRSREVAQSWLTTVYTTLRAIIQSIRLVFLHQPDLILCNGPGTCVPVCCAAFLLKILCICDSRIIFIESICRTQTLSLTGKILYCFVDKCFVQWPELHLKYPKTEYIGRLV